MTIAIVDVGDLACDITTIADMASRPLDLSHLPEFAFSPRVERKPAPLRYLRPRWGEMPVRLGPPAPPMATNPRKVHDPLPVTPAEAKWLAYKSIFGTEPRKERKPPMGTAPSLGALGEFVDKVTEIEAIAKTQFLELATTQQELAQTGVTSYALSSSDDDDDMGLEVSEEERERAATRYGTAYTTYDLTPMMDTLFNEQYNYRCGPAHRIYLDITSGEPRIQAADRKVPKTLIDEVRPTFRKLMKETTVADLAHQRIAVGYYGNKVGSFLYGVRSGEHVPEQSFDDLIEVRSDARDGAKELRFHEVNEDERLDQNEPPETVLWPITVDELADTISKGQRLNDIEWRWLEQNPLDFQALADGGYLGS
jgi:hypothetical protein